MNENLKSGMHRRDAIKGMSAGAAAIASGTAFAGEKKSADKNFPGPILENPVSKYPRPPFREQSQPWPGLAGKMDPRPDHGEESYKGTGRLTGRKALITGGDSGMGRAAAIAYAREGADVAINYLPAEEEDAKEVIKLIRDAGRKAAAIPGDLREESFCQKLVTTALRELGGLDILVNNAGRQQTRASILDVSRISMPR
jgi:short subunit dehydrogenase